MSLNYTTDPMAIGAPFIPSGINKKVSLSGVAVDGVLEAPQNSFDLLLGDPATIDALTTVQSVNCIVVPGYYVEPDYSSVYFDIDVQVNYTTQGVQYRHTERIRIVVNTPAPEGMTNFVVSDQFMPFIESYVVGIPQVDILDGVYKTKTVLTLAAFTIPSSGKATIQVPLALE